MGSGKIRFSKCRNSNGFEVPTGSGKQNKSMQNQKIKSINQSINQLMDKSIKRAIFTNFFM